MKQFDLSLWLKDKSRKVVTRDGRKQWSKTLLDLARKELLKDLPKWKKGTPPSATTLYVILMMKEIKLLAED